MTAWLRSIRIGIKNLITWFPVIWGDRQWSFGYLFRIMRKKLALMEPAIRYGQFVGCEKEADNIRLCVMLLDRIVKDECCDPQDGDVEYLFKIMNKHWGKWWD